MRLLNALVAQSSALVLEGSLHSEWHAAACM